MGADYFLVKTVIWNNTETSVPTNDLSPSFSYCQSATVMMRATQQQQDALSVKTGACGGEGSEMMEPEHKPDLR